jgi:lysyl endopeptidase
MIGASGEYAAYVFVWDGADWLETTKLTHVGGAPEDFFGSSVAIGSDYGIVGAYGIDSNAGSAFVYDGISYLTAAIYRFWSPVYSRHFYTISKAERDKLLYDYSWVWMYESIAYYAFPGQNVLDVMPVYRFWSGTLNSHFYTMDEAERDKLINIYSYVWTYEGPVFYAYPEGLQPFDAVPVYRFWSAPLGTHFYTSDAAERDKLITLYPHIWTYEGIAWYAYLP